jgi:hypothetical protein
VQTQHLPQLPHGQLSTGLELDVPHGTLLPKSETETAKLFDIF